jgi:hypothetical protein
MPNTAQTTITASYRLQIAKYRLPKEGRCSTTLFLMQQGDTFTMLGGRYGAHTITTDDQSRVRAHWAGYCSNNRGREVKPGTIKFIAKETK